MREVKQSDGLLQFLRQAETTRVLEMAGATNIWAHTRTEGVLDGIKFQMRQSVSPYKGYTNSIEASFIMVLDKAITTALEQEDAMTRSTFTIRFDDLMKNLAEAVKALGYWSVDMEFGTDLRFNLCNRDPKGEPRLDSSAALAQMRADAPKIRRLFDAMNAEALRRITQQKASHTT